MMLHWKIHLLALTVLTGCSGGGAAPDASPQAAADASASTAELPTIGVEPSTRFVFTWVNEDGHFQVTRSRDDVPEARRELVRVQDTQSPPSPDTVLVADLREPRGGSYPLREVSRDEWLRLVGHAVPPPTTPQRAAAVERPSAPAAAPADAGAQRVVMYMSSHCPVCRRARRWMTREGIPFVERDVDRDQSAVQELAALARRHGVQPRGVPVFDVGGQLIMGFDEGALNRALGR